LIFFQWYFVIVHHLLWELYSKLRHPFCSHESIHSCLLGLMKLLNVTIIFENISRFWSLYIVLLLRILFSNLHSRCSLLVNLVCDSRCIWDSNYHPWILECNKHFHENLIEKSRLLCCCNNVTRLKLHYVWTCPSMLMV
jgi:hypothetical protein